MNFRSRLVSASACVALVLAGTAAAVQPSAATPAVATARAESGVEARLGGILDAWRERTGAPGATAAVALPDGRLIAVASGIANRSAGRAMEPGDRMFSGSIGKTYVAAVMLQLVQEGRADLDAKLSTWLGDRPWFSRLPNADAVTLRHLMSHTSGIPEHVHRPEFLAALRAEPDKVWSPEQIIQHALDRRPLFAPGEGWAYADTNYILVGMVIEKIAGRPFYDELRARILEPLGLDDTTPSDRRDPPGLAAGYAGPNHPFPIGEAVAEDGRFPVHPQFEWCGGGLVSTSADLARWAMLLYAGDVLEPEMRGAMLDGVPAKTGPRDRYGLGAQIWPGAHGETLGHSGWFPPYVSQMSYYPAHRAAAAVQVNTDTRAGAMKLRDLLDELVGAALADAGEAAP